MTPTQRSLKMLRDHDWYAEVVEHFNSFTKRRHDLFGFADIIALKKDYRPLLVQVTSGSNVSARLKKIEESELIELVRFSFVVQVHGWRKIKKKRGGKAMIWQPRICFAVPQVEASQEECMTWLT